MGYTNYWHQYNDFTDEEWKQIKEEYEYIKEVCENVIKDETITTDEIVFNGKESLSHETLYSKKMQNHLTLKKIMRVKIPHFIFAKRQ